MKLLALLPVFATAVLASPDSSSAEPAPPADPTPVGALWTASWTASSLAPYTQSCASRATHKAAIYTLAQLYPDLETFAPQLKVFYNKQQYPGSWDGVDKHGNERELIKMDMADVPWKVREWIKKESTQRHYSVHDDVVFFAPGAIYPILPLWVDGSEEVGCEGGFHRSVDSASADVAQVCSMGWRSIRMSRRMEALLVRYRIVKKRGRLSLRSRR